MTITKHNHGGSAHVTTEKCGLCGTVLNTPVTEGGAGTSLAHHLPKCPARDDAPDAEAHAEARR